jgi:hypothetical protein
MMKILTHKEIEFMMYYELVELTCDLITEKPLTPEYVSEIRHKVENAWVNLNIEYSKGEGYFSNEMFNYYLHSSFEAEFGTTIN